MKHILIVEDDTVIAEVEKDYLEANGYTVEVAHSGEVGLQKALTEPYDLIILDLMLPVVDGFAILREVREAKNIPILLVSAKKEDIDKIRGLGLGADDHISKPFSLGELVARVKAHLARYDRLVSDGSQSQRAPQDEIRMRGLRIDKLARKVYVRGQEVAFTSKEYELLLFLATHPNWVFSKNDLFEKIWGLDSLGDIATVTVHISKLREKIEIDPTKPQYIETVWGVGYRFQL
ncbi:MULTISPECIES: response regulator transcription factor [Brevibacillus]|jgi:DNA-binding response OmpR family regulator|uniref:DNA-binding response regulator n=1 Tax=Brevibacillus parabrevis TaxID=54914 RepID=A0A4Y3PML4_BREPA|nr:MULTISPECIES: response regulator transcription factor [Brevibacillus]MDH6350377.1 DNA-binding response OmpR family regulator [Brevibacillus sp. 1238]MDR5001809.1 response regulator transcription factor [Brevibacillus parabrevis]MED2253449.1 response regulator transcription factor [Brevibacillus parabrevis]NRQ55756.1 response regulator transcription factor [Brevibacillus sp. HD1.4A]RNB95082.1 DNA-binding response regulator [Brevibacillus parabrevis]